MNREQIEIRHEMRNVRHTIRPLALRIRFGSTPRMQFAKQSRTQGHISKDTHTIIAAVQSITN